MFFCYFFIPLSSKTYTFESISGKLLWEALAELREALGKLREGLEELWEALYIRRLTPDQPRSGRYVILLAGPLDRAGGSR